MKPQPETSNQEVLAGLIERVTYPNAENGFCVLRAKARGDRDVVTVVGHAATIAAGEWVPRSGQWVNDRPQASSSKRASCAPRHRPCCDHPGAHLALPHATAESSLHRGYTRQAAGRVGRAEKGRRHRRAKRLRPTEVVEAGGMAASWSTHLTKIWRGGVRLSRHGRLTRAWHDYRFRRRSPPLR